jgi:polar amino acid transport system substrate-binding protein
VDLVTARIAAFERLIVLALVCLAMTSSAPAQTLDRIQATKTLRIGFIADHAPFASSESGGPPVGFAIDLCNEVVGQVDKHIPGVKVEYVETTITEAFGAVADDHIDMLCGAITATLDRRETVDFRSRS